MGRPKTTCFAYEKVNGQSLCKALNETAVKAAATARSIKPFRNMKRKRRNTR